MSTIEKGDEELCRLIHELMMSETCLCIIEETVGKRNHNARFPIRTVFMNFLLDPTNSTNNDELFHIECLFNTQKVFYSKIQLAMHAQTTMKNIKVEIPGKNKISQSDHSLSKKVEGLSCRKVEPVLFDGNNNNSPSKLMKPSIIETAPQGDEINVISEGHSHSSQRSIHK